jgi:hypothetical protein
MEDWKSNWEAYLNSSRGTIVDWIKPNVNGSIRIDLKDIDFYIPPLLATNSDDFKAIQKHNAKKRIF